MMSLRSLQLVWKRGACVIVWFICVNWWEPNTNQYGSCSLWFAWNSSRISSEKRASATSWIGHANISHNTITKCLGMDQQDSISVFVMDLRWEKVLNLHRSFGEVDSNFYQIDWTRAKTMYQCVLDIGMLSDFRPTLCPNNMLGLL